MSCAVLPRPQRVAVIGTVAGGLGDISFIANLVQLLCMRPSGPQFTVDVILCQQAGGDAEESLRVLLRHIEENGGVPPGSVGVTCCTHRLASGACGTEFVHLVDGVASRRPSPPLAGCPDRFLQGPLVLFTTGESAAATLIAGVPAAHTKPPPLLTIREFGQGGFCARRPRSDTPGTDADVSAGLAAGEVGIFRLLPVPPFPPLGPQLPPYIVGYFRSGQHYASLGRLAASVLLCEGAAPPFTVTGEASSSDGCGVAVVFGPWSPAGAAEAESEAPLVARFVDAVAKHPGVLRADLVQPQLPHSSPQWFPWLPSDTCREVASVEVELTSRSGEGGFRRQRLLLVSLPGLALTAVRFRALLAGAEAAIVTGDASLNEAICFGVPLWYSSEPHKAGTLAALRSITSSGTGAAEAVAAWWAYIDGPRNTKHMGAEEVSGAAEALWDTYRAALAAVSARESPPMCRTPNSALRLVFKTLWAAAASAPATESGLRFIDESLAALLTDPAPSLGAASP